MQCPAHFLLSYTIQDPLLREWFHPLWAGFPISINLIKATPTPDMPIGQPNQENLSLSLLPEVILAYIMSAIKANHWPGGGCARL